LHEIDPIRLTGIEDRLDLSRNAEQRRAADPTGQLRVAASLVRAPVQGLQVRVDDARLGLRRACATSAAKITEYATPRAPLQICREWRALRRSARLTLIEFFMGTPS
jgi:hypothetical protein